MATIIPDQVQVLLLEMQPATIAAIRTAPQDVLRKAAAAVARISDSLGLPMLASVVPLGSAEPELIAELAALQPITRTTITPFGANAQRARLEAAGRKVLAVGGVSSEIAVLNTVLDALGEGYEVHVLLDCCGGLSERSDAAALRRMELAGAVPSNVSSFFTSMIDDMATPQGGSVMGALAEMWGWNAEGDAPADAQVAAVIETMQGAWRAGDPAKFAGSFTRGARFVAFDGVELKGREAITAYHAAPFATYLAGTELTMDVQEVRAMTPDVLLVSSRGGIVKDGSSQGDLVGLSTQTLVLVRQDGQLLADAFQNTRIRPIDGPATADIWKAFDRAWSSRGNTNSPNSAVDNT